MALANVAGRPQWLADPRFATLDARLANQDALETEVTAWTSGEDAFALMHRLQAAGVPAGVCQTAQDKIERDPQLAALDWLTEVTGTRIGRWPVAELPMKFSRSTAHIGGVTEARGAHVWRGQCLCPARPAGVRRGRYPQAGRRRRDLGRGGRSGRSPATAD